MSRFLALTAVLALAAILVSTGSANSQGSAQTEYPTLYVQYALNCTFTIVNESGIPVTSIPPGAYEVAVTTPIMFSQANIQNLAPGDFTGCRGYVQFQLTGPGVSLSTTLFNGCDSFQVLSAQNFQPSSTYTAQDNNQPSVARVVFSTLASGSPVIPKSPLGVATGKGTSSTDIVGSTLPPATSSETFRGALAGAVSPAGRLSLTYKGKTVATLETGRYTFSVVDRSRKSGFIVQEIHKAATTVAGSQFVGTRSMTIDLKAGQWFFYPALGGKKDYFTVMN